MARYFLGKDSRGNDMYYDYPQTVHFRLNSLTPDEDKIAEDNTKLLKKLMDESDERLKKIKKNTGMFAWFFDFLDNFGKDFSGEPQS